MGFPERIDTKLNCKMRKGTAVNKLHVPHPSTETAMAKCTLRNTGKRVRYGNCRYAATHRTNAVSSVCLTYELKKCASVWQSALAAATTWDSHRETGWKQRA